MSLGKLIGVWLVAALLMWGAGELPFLDKGFVKVARIIVFVVLGLWTIDVVFGFGLTDLRVGPHR